MTRRDFKGMPLLGFGTWEIPEDEAEEAVRDALDVGYRHIDTARAYDNETGVGRGIASSGVSRDEIWLTTKIWPEDFEPKALEAAAEDSLRNLGTDMVDLLLLHWPSKEHPLEPTLEALASVRERGLAREIGVSNFSNSQLRRALELAPVFTNQVEFHPFLGQDELLDIAEERDICVTAYAPLAHGKAVEDETLREIAERHGRSAAQVALAYLLDKPRTAVIPKASSRERREENYEALAFQLSPEDVSAIDALPKDQRDFDGELAPDWD